ncbi:MAG: MMPL family transporter [bacterium]|nr:MMPL family transporter [bacterium]
MKISTLRIDASANSMMIKDDTELVYYHETLKKFGSDNIVVIFIRDKEIFTPEKLAHIDELVNDLGSVAGVRKVESLFSVTNLKNSDGMLNNNPLMDYVPETPEEAASVKRDALKNPILTGNLISTDGTATAINLYLEEINKDSGVDIGFSTKIENIIKNKKGYFEKIFQVGAPFTRKTISDIIRYEQMTLVPLAIVALLMMLVITTRSMVSAVLPLLTSGLSIFLTLGFMGYMNFSINILTFIIPALLIVIGSTEDVHIISEYTEGMRKENSIKDKAIQFAASKVGTAIILTTITTFLGFLSISVNKISVLRQFGITAAFGLLINFIVTILLAPPYLRYFGSKKSTSAENMSGPLNRFLDSISNKALYLICKKGKITLIVILGFALFIGLFSYKVRIDNDTLGFFRKDSPIIKRMQALHENLSGGQTFFIRISCGNTGEFKKPGSLKQLDDIKNFIEQKGWFDKSISLADYIKLIHKEMNAGNKQFSSIPGSENLVAQYLLFLHREEIESYVTPDFAEANILVRHNITSSQELSEVLAKTRNGVKNIINPYYKFNITGENILINRAADSIAIGQVQGIVLLLIVICIVMTILFVTIKAGLLSMIPNIFPVVTVFGIMGIFDITLNTGTCMIAAIAIGISVDDTIHLMSRYNKEMREIQNMKKAIEASLKSEIRPVFSTSIGLMLGFGIMGLSNLLPIAHFGILSAFVMFTALLGDFLVTPILLSTTQIITIWDMASLELKNEIWKSSLFKGCKKRQIKKVILLGQIEKKEKGDVIIRQGDWGRSMFVILNGSVQVSGTNIKTKKEYKVSSLPPGSVFGELALLKEGPRKADIIAKEAVILFKIDWNGLKRVQRVFPRISSKIYRNLSIILGGRLIELDNKLFHGDKK